MSRPPFNPHLSIASPFPREELPTLFCWMDRIRDTAVGDEVPRDLNKFVEFQLEREMSYDLKTWVISKDGTLGVYIEQVAIGRNAFMANHDETLGIEEALLYSSQASVVFKRDLWGLKNTVPALNLGLKSIFDTGTETVFFPSFADNRALIELFKAVGCSSLGRTLPRMRKGVPATIELWAITATEWETRNVEYLRESEEVHDTTAITVDGSDDKSLVDASVGVDRFRFDKPLTLRSGDRLQTDFDKMEARVIRNRESA